MPPSNHSPPRAEVCQVVGPHARNRSKTITSISTITLMAAYQDARTAGADPDHPVWAISPISATARERHIGVCYQPHSPNGLRHA